MSALVLRPARFGDRAIEPLRPPMPRLDENEPCGGELVVDFALCIVLAAAVVGLLLLAL